MTSEPISSDADRIHTLFEGVVELPTPEARHYLAQHCRDQVELARVMSLLRIHHEDAHFMFESAAADYRSLAAVTDRCFGEFRIIRELGRGGMGVVYLAEDLQQHVLVALKILHEIHALSKTAILRFENEAETAQRLSHPNIVKLHRFGVAQNKHYIATNYIDGLTLAEIIASKRESPASTESIDSSSNPFPQWVMAPHTNSIWISQITQIVSCISSALSYSHRHGVIHRDVKPSNILVDRNSKPWLVDFGVAKILDGQSLTASGDSLGTYRYMSPEQAKAITADLDHRTDIFSLGVTLYEALALSRPFHGDSLEEIAKAHRRGAVTPIRQLNPNVSRGLDAVCRIAIATYPKQRYPSTNAFRHDLDSAIHERRTHAEGLLVHRQLVRAGRSRPMQILVLAALVLISAAVARGLWLSATTTVVVISTERAKVWSQQIDVESDTNQQREYVGSGPIQFRLRTGTWRLLIRQEERYAELTRDMVAGDSLTLNPVFRSTQRAIENMVLVPAGQATIGISNELGQYGERQVAIAAFWIDETEVSNRQYKEYVDATRASPPLYWPEPYDSAIDSLPVVGVSFREAQMYAEWVGKRLPTAIEWEWAARGMHGHLYPWGNDASDIPQRANVTGHRNEAWSDQIDNAESLAIYKEAVQPIHVGFALEDRTSDGLVHMFGNISEWTESPYVALLDGKAVVRYEERIIKGSHWGTDLGSNMNLSHFIRGNAMARTLCFGFRCAKSVLTDSITTEN